jgi:hypothetical protein
VTGVGRKRHRQGDSGRRCIFADVMGCSGQHPPWNCKLFGNIRAKEREKIIEDNRLCAFCLLHDRAKTCGAKERQANPACHAPGCKGRHIRKLHELLKDMHKEENQVHLVQGGDAWAIDGEEEAMIVGTIQQEDNSSWQEASSSWMELDEEGGSGVYCVGTCQGTSSQPPEVGEKCPNEASRHLGKEEEGEDEEFIKDGWWSPDLRELQIEEGEQEYFIELLMGGSTLGGGKAAPGRAPAAGSTTGQPAKKGVASEPEAQNPGKARESKPNTSKGKGRSSKEAPGEKNQPGIKTGGKRLARRVGRSQRGDGRAAGSRRGRLTLLLTRDLRTR